MIKIIMQRNHEEWLETRSQASKREIPQTQQSGIESEMEEEMALEDITNNQQKFPIVPVKRKGVRPSKKMDEEIEQKLVQSQELNISQVCWRQNKSPQLEKSDSGLSNSELEEKMSFQYQKEKSVNCYGYPYSAVGMVCHINEKNEIDKFGTGSLIGPNIVLTCAHNCYQDYQKKDNYCNVIFCPSPIFEKSSLKRGFKVTNMLVPEAYKSGDKKLESQFNSESLSIFDYAILYLEVDINLEDYFGSFSYDFQFNQNLSTSNAPTQKIQLIEWFQQERSIDLKSFKFQAVNDLNYLFYTVPTNTAGSGSPLIVHSSDEYRVVAIHVLDLSEMLTSESRIKQKAALKLNKNMVKNLQSSFKRVSLENSHLGDEACQCLRQQKLNQLTDLRLRKCNIGEQGCEDISKEKWEYLTVLNLGQNKIGDKGLQHLCKAYWKQLADLRLNENNIGDQGCQYLSNANWKQLATLNLAKNSIGVEGCAYLSEAKWPQLTKFSLAWNIIGDEGCKYISQSRWENLTFLQLNGNDIGFTGCKHLSLAKLEHLTFLDLNYNNIGDYGCMHLTRARWDQLSTLLLAQNNIGVEGSRNLSYANWQKLTNLNLNYNTIESEGCSYLSQANWKKLKTLNLQCNNIRDLGCQSLRRAYWPHLSSLYLSNNRIKGDGSKYLTQANWKYLQTLSLGNIKKEVSKHHNKETKRPFTKGNENSIGDEGCRYLCQANWKKLNYLNLYANQIGQEGCRYIDLAQWEQLKTLDLGGNMLGMDGIKYLSWMDKWKQLTTLNLDLNKDEGCDKMPQKIESSHSEQYKEDSISLSILTRQDPESEAFTVSIYYIDIQNQQIMVTSINNSLLQRVGSPITESRIFGIFVKEALQRKNVSQVIALKESSFAITLNMANMPIDVPIREKIHCSFLNHKQRPAKQSTDNLDEFFSRYTQYMQKMQVQTDILKKIIDSANRSIINLEQYIKTRLQTQLEVNLKEFKATFSAESSIHGSNTQFLEKTFGQSLSLFFNSIEDNIKLVLSLDNKLDKMRYEMKYNNDEVRAEISQLKILAKEQNLNTQNQLTFMDETLRNHAGQLRSLEKNISNIKTHHQQKKLEEGLGSIKKKFSFYNPQRFETEQITRYEIKGEDQKYKSVQKSK